ncbi:hypothetical protein HBH71_022760 [Parastagonospora nodorum]|nr:hypothetical protein HBH71_022760 [Parastagonospora nodorum]
MMIADAMALVRQRTAQMHELESQSEWRITAMTWTWTNTQTTCHSTCSEAFLFKGAQCSFAVLICCNPNGRSDKRNRQAHTKPSSLKNITKTPSSSDSIWNGTLSRLGLLANSQGKLRSSMDEA